MVPSSSEVSKEKSTKGCATLTDSCGIRFVYIYVISHFDTHFSLVHFISRVDLIWRHICEIIEIRRHWIETSKFVKQEQCRVECSYQDFMCSSFTRDFRSEKDKSWNRKVTIWEVNRWPWLKRQKLVKQEQCSAVDRSYQDFTFNSRWE